MPQYYLFVFGVGPMADDWYSFIMDDDAIYENGLLLISTLALRDTRPDNYVHFFFDLAGIIHPYGVIGVGSDKPKGEHLIPILDNLHTHPDRWTKHASSFTEWLERLVETIGSFGYV
jgi:hypothetical protein